MDSAESGPKVGFRSRPKRGETVCGDCCEVWQTDARLVLAVADGLGHGQSAKDAAELAMATVAANLSLPLQEVFETCDRELRDSRGAAFAVAAIEPGSDRLTFASVGNIRAVLLASAGDFRMGGAWGIVGAGFSKLNPEQFTLAPGDMLAIYTDGLNEILPLRTVLAAADVSPEAAAESILDQWAPGQDDAAVLIYRH